MDWNHYDLGCAQIQAKADCRRAQASGCCAAMRSASAASSGVLTLKNGSTGATGQSANATPCRAVQTSILRRPSSVTASRRSSRNATGHSADHRMPPFARARAGERQVRLLPRLMQPRDQIARQERTVARHAGDVGDAGRMRRRPVEPRENAGQRTGEIRHVVGHHRQTGRGEARRIAIGVDDEPTCIAGEAAPARDRGWSRRRSS